MKSIVKCLATLGLVLSLPLVTGCGESNPMAPEPPPAPEYIDVTVTLMHVLAVADGDGIEGAGEFSFEATVNDGPGPLVVTGSPTLNDGETSAIGRSKVMRIEKDAAYNIQVKFRATEWDQNIFGTVYADTRMDNLSEERVHRNGNASAGFNDGERWITLGTGDLQLRLVYRITSRPVV